MKVLITGSSGRVGAAITELVAEHHDVVGLDLVPGRYTTHIGSVAERATVLAAAAGVDAIIHTASLHVPDLHRASPEAFASTNVQGTSNLLQAAAEHRISRFVYSSTTSVYGRAMPRVIRPSG
jgi:UDP-glucose 4-epimerase